MKTYRLDYKKNNTEALDERLRAVFGARFVGMGSSDAGVWFEFNDAGEDDDEARLQDELDKHDPDELPERQKNLQARRKPDMKAMRAKLGQAGKRDELLSEILDMLEDLQGGE